jgi:hypothetical protein
VSATLDDSEIIDDVGRHIRESVPLEKATVPLGVYFSWCVNLQLIHPDFAAAHESEVLRVRMRELTPGEFFVRAAGGSISADQLNERGRLFTQMFYPGYLEAYREALALERESLFEAEDGWNTYDAVAPTLTKCYYAFADAGHKPPREDRKHWWQRWRS